MITPSGPIRIYSVHLDHIAVTERTLQIAHLKERAFAYARERSTENDPVAENRAAIVALGILLGHWRVETLVGRVLDEVILPAFSFVSTANAFRLRGAQLRFVDVRPDTLNLDEGLVATAIGPRTRAIVPVHYAGVGAEMDALMALAARHDLVVVEDAAQALGATYRQRPLGSVGHLAAFSFHETKNFIAGQGGALVVNDPRFIARADVLAEKGTDRERFFRGDSAAGRDVTWLRPDGGEMAEADWRDAASHVLGMLIHESAADERDERGRPIGGRRLLLLVNGGPRSRSFALPPGTWESLLDTARTGSRLVKTPAVNLVAHSLVLLRHTAA